MAKLIIMMLVNHVLKQKYCFIIFLLSIMQDLMNCRELRRSEPCIPWNFKVQQSGRLEIYLPPVSEKFSEFALVLNW